MTSLKRFIQAIRHYYQTGQAGDIAFLKTDIFGSGASARVKQRLRALGNYNPPIDLAQLQQLPMGSLGHTYAQHMLRSGIQPLNLSPDLEALATRRPFGRRYTATHDVLHILLGFDTSYAGEMGVFAFTVAQGFSRYFTLAAPLAFVLYPVIAPLQIRRSFANWRRGYRLGKQARFLLDYKFEADWSRSIEDLRAELGLVTVSKSLGVQMG